jgi:hypothetical protein
MSFSSKFAIWYWSIGIAVAIGIGIWTWFYTQSMTIEQSTIFLRDFCAYSMMCALGIILLAFTIALIYTRFKR